VNLHDGYIEVDSRGHTVFTVSPPLGEAPLSASLNPCSRHSETDDRVREMSESSMIAFPYENLPEFTPKRWLNETRCLRKFLEYRFLPYAKKK